jgi:hypothetical protein
MGRGARCPVEPLLSPRLGIVYDLDQSRRGKGVQIGHICGRPRGIGEGISGLPAMAGSLGDAGVAVINGVH